MRPPQTRPSTPDQAHLTRRPRSGYAVAVHNVRAYDTAPSTTHPRPPPKHAHTHQESRPSCGRRRPGSPPREATRAPARRDDPRPGGPPGTRPPAGPSGQRGPGTARRRGRSGGPEHRPAPRPGRTPAHVSGRAYPEPGPARPQGRATTPGGSRPCARPSGPATEQRAAELQRTDELARDALVGHRRPRALEGERLRRAPRPRWTGSPQRTHPLRSQGTATAQSAHKRSPARPMERPQATHPGGATKATILPTSACAAMLAIELQRIST